jgi:hypothetical protein
MITPAAHNVLHQAWCEGNVIKLPPDQLERVVYEEVNEVIQRLGGKWKGGRTKGHVFDFYDPAPLLASVQASGIMPPKNPTAFFPTPAPIVADMVRISGIAFSGWRILEPSAGTGAIADAIRAAAPDAQIDVCEVLDLNRALLEGKGYSIVAEDFLDWKPGPIYDAVLMNPPFSVEKDKAAWLTHLMHAWSLLKNGGKLVCIAPANITFGDNSKLNTARDLILQYGGIDDIPAGAFKDSGTGVATAFIWMNKESQEWREREYNGWVNYHQWLLFLHIDNDQKDTDAFNALLDAEAANSELLAFLNGIVKQARGMGDWIAWDEQQQQLALAECYERAGRVLEAPMPKVETFDDLPLFAI